MQNCPLLFIRSQVCLPGFLHLQDHIWLSVCMFCAVLLSVRVFFHFLFYIMTYSWIHCYTYPSDNSSFFSTNWLRLSNFICSIISGRRGIVTQTWDQILLLAGGIKGDATNGGHGSSEDRFDVLGRSLEHLKIKHSARGHNSGLNVKPFWLKQWGYSYLDLFDLILDPLDGVPIDVVPRIHFSLSHHLCSNHWLGNTETRCQRLQEFSVFTHWSFHYCLSY